MDNLAVIKAEIASEALKSIAEILTNKRESGKALSGGGGGK